MPVDPRICCAAGVCCDPPGARAATISLLEDLGMTDKGEAERVADAMVDRKIVLFDATVTETIREMVTSGQSVTG
jgi:hypothetical protein